MGNTHGGYRPSKIGPGRYTKPRFSPPGPRFGQGQEHQLKSCGNKHASCSICRPDIIPFRRNQHTSNCQCPWHRDKSGEKNPAWKGGPGYEWNGAGWKAARQKIWERDQICQLCYKLPLSSRHLDVHHIVERRDGGSNELNNLVGLHHSCHTKVHKYPGLGEWSPRHSVEVKITGSNPVAGANF